MADCYYHGNSGGPGGCPDCARAEREYKKPEDVRSTSEYTMADIDRAWHKRGRMIAEALTKNKKKGK